MLRRSGSLLLVVVCLLSASVCAEIIEGVNPEAEIVVWSDMFDQHHNARKDYSKLEEFAEGVRDRTGGLKGQENRAQGQ